MNPEEAKGILKALANDALKAGLLDLEKADKVLAALYTLCLPAPGTEVEATNESAPAE